MPYKRIKWLILWIPTVTIALWEYLRHTFLLPYLSMDLGNLLAPIIVLIVTLTLGRKLMLMLEQSHESLQRERAVKSALVEREQMARELHDGISQSLFLLAVKLDRLEKETREGPAAQTVGGLKETVRRVYDDVRQSIASLRKAPAAAEEEWMQAIVQLSEELEDAGTKVEMKWRIMENELSSREKVELIAIVREAMLNVQKHAKADRLIIEARSDGSGGFSCRIEDNGIGAALDQLEAKGRYGVRMMQSRAKEMGWKLETAPFISADGDSLPDKRTDEGRHGLTITVMKKGGR